MEPNSSAYIYLILFQMCAKNVPLSPTLISTLMKSYAEGSSIHGTSHISISIDLQSILTKRLLKVANTVLN